MPPHFVINFRREAFQRERERNRRRLLAIGAWVTYFGLMALLIGLYGLNCQAVTARTRRIERQVARERENSAERAAWQPGPAEAEFVQARRESPLLWHRRLQRLSELLPRDASLASVAINPDNLPDPAARNLLVVAGRLRAGSSAVAMGSVVDLVGALNRDSVFSRGFSSIQLASSRASQEGPPAVEFVVECR